MGRIPYFIGGCFIGSLQVMSQVYETEIVKQDLKNEVETLRKMKNFVNTYFILSCYV
jgi:hypothetical protein